MGEAVDLNDEGASGGGATPAAHGSGAPEATGAFSLLRQGARRQVEATVRLRCEGRVGIHTGFVRDLSRGGMFLRIVDPEPAGRRLAFELWLPGRRSPARGLAEVAWQRLAYEGPGRPSGMALRFLALEAPAFAVLGELLPGAEPPDVARLERESPSIEMAVRARAEEAALESAPAATEPPTAGSGSTAPFLIEPLFPLEPLFELELPVAEEAVAAPSRPVQIVPSARKGRRRERVAVAVAPAEERRAEQLPLPLAAPPRWRGDIAPPLAAVDEQLPGAAATVAATAAGGVRGIPPSVPLLVAGPSSPRAWRPAVAGTAAIAALAALAVVGAARFGDASSTESMVAVPAPPAVAPTVPVAMAPPPPMPAPARPLPHVVLPAAPAAPAASSTARTAAASRVLALHWEPLATGGTRVVVRLDGAFAAERLRSSHIGGDSPRQVVRLLGLAGPVPRGPSSPATAELLRIRSGRHQDEGGSEVHLVLDLATPAVRLVGAAVVGDELRLDLAPAAEPAGG